MHGWQGLEFEKAMSAPFEKQVLNEDSSCLFCCSDRCWLAGQVGIRLSYCGRIRQEGPKDLAEVTSRFRMDHRDCPILPIG